VTAIRDWPDAGVTTYWREATMADKVFEDVLAKIKTALELQNQIDTLRAQQAAALQQAAMIIEVMNPGGGKPEVTRYNQRDPGWAGIQLGSSVATIGSHGCLITCAASLLTDAGKVYTPATLNAWLVLNGGYSGGNRFVFTAIDKLHAVKMDYQIECATVAAPVAQLDAEIKAGKWVIVKVDFNPGTVETEEHWVRYLGDGEMFDPWVGDIAPMVPRYRGKDAAEAILRAVIYKPKPAV
jgi:hypothetical protein